MKKLILILASLMMVGSVYSQTDDGEVDFFHGIEKKEKANAFFVGPKIGATFSSISNPEQSELSDGMGIGFSGGLALKTRFGRASENSTGGTGYWGIGLELKYSLNSMKTLATDQNGKENANLSLSYFDIPVFLQVYPLAKVKGANSLYIEAGVNFGLLTGKSPETLTTKNTGGQYALVTYNINTADSKLKGGNICPLIGLGYTFPGTGLDINLRYNIGMTNLAGNFQSKPSSLQISLAWLFNAGKF